MRDFGIGHGRFAVGLLAKGSAQKGRVHPKLGMTIGVLFGCFGGKNRWVSIPGVPGGFCSSTQGNPCICPERTPPIGVTLDSVSQTLLVRVDHWSETHGPATYS